MDGNWGEVNDILDFIDHIWIGFIFIACAVIPSWFAARNHRGIKAIRDNVQNGHEVPLREDLDRTISAIDNLTNNVQALTDDVAGLRQDLLTERDSRKAQVDDLRSDVDRIAHRRRRNP